MLKRTLILLILALSQFGCGFEYGEGKWPYEVIPLSDKGRQEGERIKRELLQLEDIKVGDGPVAAWGRKISAEIEVRYTDGTLVYQGPAFTYFGFKGMPETSVYHERHLSDQPGILIGLNGMAVGGKRRITVDRSLVCTAVKADAGPGAGCHLVGYDDFRNSVRKEKLIVEATLTESCLPVVFKGPYIISQVVRCRDSDTPKLDSTLPIWHVY
jgi:hypothetical protein